MRVLVTGLTGYVGHELGQTLLEAGHHVTALLRAGSEDKLGTLRGHVTVKAGDVTDAASLPAALDGIDAVIHLVGILNEDPRRGVTFDKLHWQASRDLIDAAERAGVKRFVHMSANGAKLDGTAYQHTKAQAEAHLRASGLDWTIFRPSVIFGETHGRMAFVNELAKPMRLAPAFPLFGDGSARLQPVHVHDVALAFTRALTTPATIRQSYCLGGPQTLSYKQVVRLISTALGRPLLPLVPVPLPLVTWGVGVGEHLPGFPLTRDQLTMLLEGNTCEAEAWPVLGLAPRAFTVASLSYLTTPEPEQAPCVAAAKV